VALKTPTPAVKRGRRTAVTAVGAIVGLVIVVVAIGGKWGSVEHAISRVSLAVLAGATLLQLGSLVARSEAWYRCVRAAGGTVGRRRLFRAASVGYLGNLVNGEFGFAMRIAALRRSAPRTTPKLATLATTEVPILLTELVLAVLVSFTLVGPLGWPWWIPLVLLAVTAGVTVAVSRSGLSSRLRGWLSGLAVLKDPGTRWRMAGIVLVAMLAQILRNWVVLQASGLDVSVLDATAVLLGVAVLGILPLGPSTGTGATLLILGSHDLGAVAAAGLLLTATGALGSLSYGAWALGDRGSVLAGRLNQRRAHHVRTRRAEGAAAAVQHALSALPALRRERFETTYFGGVTHEQVARILTPFHAARPVLA
jgi:uncharacterized membrane protein YbhN (UPF0104 family)